MNNTAIQKPKFSAMIQTTAYQKSLQNALSDPKEIQKFTAAITSVVSTNPQLEECTANTILSAALCGHSLQLAPSPQLGQYYMVPFKDRKNNRTVATFVLGYRGYIQLALRSGYYKNINVMEVKEGELISADPFNEEYVFNYIRDEEKREVAETVGYYACYLYLNGFKKALYWTKDKMKAHALKYSAGYANDIKKGTEYTFWAKDFDGMAKKTMLRQLISKWGIMSVEMQNAYLADGAIVDNGGNPVEYTDNENYTENVVQTEAEAPINVQPNNVPQVAENNAPLSIDDLTD